MANHPSSPLAMVMSKMASIRTYFNRPRLVDLLFLAILWTISMLIGIAFLLLITNRAEAAQRAPEDERIATAPAPLVQAVLSRGDRIALIIADGEGFAGQYQVNQHGALELPDLGQVNVAGLDTATAAGRVSDALVRARLFKAGRAQVSLQVLEWAGIDVYVAGAVYLPGRVKLNQPPSRDRAPEAKTDLPGARMPERRLSDALRIAGGIRPTADLAQIEVHRQNATTVHDLRGLLSGDVASDPQLFDGDSIVVRSSGQVDPRLARPSALTPPGIRILVSNLTSPASNNNASTVDHGSLSLPFGSRFSQAVIAANCAGGTSPTNAGRSALLTRTDRISGKTQGWSADIEELLQSTEETPNPLLEEGDGLTCYDSPVTSVRDVFRAIADIVLPFRSLR